jgi:pimeloyl-ACP methyl ester carboxylesterase
MAVAIDKRNQVFFVRGRIQMISHILNERSKTNKNPKRFADNISPEDRSGAGCLRSFITIILLITAVMYVGCSGPYSARLIDATKLFKKHNENALNSNNASWKTQQYLRLKFLDKEYEKDPLAVTAQLVEIARETKDAYSMEAAAELSLLNARKMFRKNRDIAVTMLFDSAEISYDYVLSESSSTSFSTLKPSYLFMAAIYNRAISRFAAARRGRKEPLQKTASYKHANSTYDFHVHTDEPYLWNPKIFDELIPADEIQTRGLRNQYKAKGLGAPLIGFVKNPKEKAAFGEYFPRTKQAYPVTAVLIFEPPEKLEDGWHRKVTLEFYDPMARDTISINNKEIPLEADFTTPLGIQLTNVKPLKIGLLGLFASNKLAEESGMFFLEPYREDKVPVVMVHGLMSSPVTWVEMFNDLRGDTELRKKYQFWFFSYPTGLPILYSGSLLRKELKEIRAEFDPDNNNPNFDQMVLIGHSMGGLLSRQMVQESEDVYWDSVFAEPIDAIEFNDSTRELLEEVFFFESLPFVKRVIFVATPHVGSDIADKGFSKFFAGFIHLPRMLEDTANLLISREDIDFAFNHEDPGKVYNSIELLSPTSRFTTATNSIPLKEDIPYHSIIGTRRDKEGPGSSDGIVKYESSHLDFTISEKLVPSGHDAQKHPLAIDEVKRILRLHLEQL